MVEADIGDEAQVGMNNIGTVQSSAKSYFDDSNIDLLSGEVMECHGCGKFEE